MKKYSYILSMTLVLGLVAMPAVVHVWKAGRADEPPAQRGHKLTGLASSGVTDIRELGNLPMSFEANQGQTASDVKFFARGTGYTLFLTSETFVVSLHKSAMGEQTQNFSAGTTNPIVKGKLPRHRVKSNISKSGEESPVLRVSLVGANSGSRATALEKLPGTTNYFIGNDPRRWTTNIPTYGRVRFEQVYRGVDLVYYGNQGQIEYDFVVAPGADPTVIQLGVEGAGNLIINQKGELVLHVRNRDLLMRQPVAYQEVEGFRRRVTARYVSESKNRVGFEVSAFDVTRPLIIDPVLSFSSYLGV